MLARYMFEAWCDALASIDQILNGFDRAVEFLALIAVEIDFDNPFHTSCADHDRHADIKALHTVFAREIGSAGKNPLFVLEIGFGHFDSRRRRRVKGRPCFKQLDDFSAAIARALDDFVQTLIA